MIAKKYNTQTDYTLKRKHTEVQYGTTIDGNVILV